MESERRSPDKMAAIFRDERQVKFNGSGDREEVGKMYQTLHEHVVKIDAQRKRGCVGLSDSVIERTVGVKNAVYIWWGLFVLWVLVALVCTINPAPSFIGAMTLFAAPLASFIYASRKWRRVHLQLLCGQKGSDGSSVGPAPAGFAARPGIAVSGPL